MQVMIQNHLFWMAVALFFCSAINLNVYKEYNKHIKIWPKVIGIVGGLGFIGGLVRLFTLSMKFNWWWAMAISGTSLLSIGVFSYLFRKKTSVVLGTINIVLIPILWWYGCMFNTSLSHDWFY